MAHGHDCIPRDRFWELQRHERNALKALLRTPSVTSLITSFRSRPHDSGVKLLDAAYWVKGCSSLGRLRYAGLLGVRHKRKRADMVFLDIKQAAASAAPRAPAANMPANDAERVVEGARHLAPTSVNACLRGDICGCSVVVRELLPQDLKLKIDRLTRAEAAAVAHHLASIVGAAHARQLDEANRKAWASALQSNHGKSLDAPSWLWSNLLDLLALHERSYLEHCRCHAVEIAAVERIRFRT